MLTLRQHQSAFALDTITFLSWATSQGYEYTFGEAFRTVEQQEIYFRTGKSTTMNSKHLNQNGKGASAMDVIDKRYGWNDSSNSAQDYFKEYGEAGKVTNNNIKSIKEKLKHGK